MPSRQVPGPALLLLAAALLAGCAAPGPPPEAPGAEGPGAGPTATVEVPSRFAHDHAAWAMFLAGERVAFNHTDYDLSRRQNVSAHLHVREPHGGGIVHLEGSFPDGIPDVTLGRFLAIHGVDFQPGALTLDTLDAHNGTTWRDGPGQRWQAWVQHGNATRGDASWAEAPEGPGLVLAEGQRVLLTYGPPTQAPRPEEAEAVPEPPLPRGAPGA